MIKLINLLICFILINNYCQSKRLHSDETFQKSSRKYDFKESFSKSFANFRTKSIDLESSASTNDALDDKDVPTYFEPNFEPINKQQNERFSNWFDIGEKSNQTSSSSLSNQFESNHQMKKSKNKSKSSTKKKWRLVSSSNLSDTSIDDDNQFEKAIVKSSFVKQSTKQKKRKKSKKFKTANIDLKLKELDHHDDFMRHRIANATLIPMNRKEDLKFRLNDAIDYKNNESNRSLDRSKLSNSSVNYQRFSNDTLSKRSQLSGESSKISKKIMLATMLPSVIKGLTSGHTHVAVLPSVQPVAQPIAVMPAIQPMPVPMPVPQVIVAQPPPRPVYQQIHIARPAQQIIAQPIIQQPIIQQPIIHQQPIVQRKIITQPIIISRPAVHVVQQPQPIQYQTVSMPVEPNCNQPTIQDDSNEDATIGDPVDDEDNSSGVQPSDDGDSYSQSSWGTQEPQPQVRIMPQAIVAQPTQTDSWGNQQRVLNQHIYQYHTASVPKTTRTIYTQTKMIPSVTSVQSTTSYTPEHRHTIVETEHNAKPVMNLVNVAHRKIVSKPVYTVKSIPQQQVIQAVPQQPTYVSNNQGSWSNK